MHKFPKLLVSKNQLSDIIDKDPVKKSSKLPKKYIDKICVLASNKITREMPGRLISIKINKMFGKR